MLIFRIPQTHEIPKQFKELNIKSSSYMIFVTFRKQIYNLQRSKSRTQIGSNRFGRFSYDLEKMAHENTFLNESRIRKQELLTISLCKQPQ